MKKLLFVVCMLFSICTMAQSKMLIADETYYVYAEKSFKIITSSTIVSNLLVNTRKYTSYSAKQKKDRWGEYWEITYVFPIEYQNFIVNQLKSIH